MGKEFVSTVKPVFDAFETMIRLYDKLGEEKRRDSKLWGPPPEEDPRRAFHVIVDNLAPQNRGQENYWYARMAHWFLANDLRPTADKKPDLIIAALPFMFSNAARTGIEAYEFVGHDKDGLKFFTRTFTVEPAKPKDTAPPKYSRNGETSVYLTPDQLDAKLIEASKWGESRPFMVFAAALKPAYVASNALPRWSRIVHPRPEPVKVAPKKAP